MDIGIESPDFDIIEAPTEQPTEQPTTLPAPSVPAEPEKVPAGV